MFFKKKEPKYTEAPLGYWEEKSYMLAIPANEEEDILKDSIDRIASIEGVEVKDNHYSIDENVIYVNLTYNKEDYEVGMYYGNITVPEFYLNKNFLFTEQEKEAVLKARRALTIFMKFSNDVKRSFHLQLKIASSIVPNLIGILDESAENMLPPKWIKMCVKSEVLPSTKDLFTIQAVYGDDKNVWLHTHGCARCGVTELEILESDKDNFKNHYNLINTYAMYLIDKKDEFEAHYNGAYIGRLINGLPVVATCVSWTEGILKYKKLKLGNIEDRKDGHNSKTSIIFLYTSEEEEKNRKLNPVSIYDKFWGDNPIFFISNEETNRMKELAIERFKYVKDNFEGNSILVKIGLPLKEPGKFEHIWFEIKEIKGNKFKAVLTQEPYDIEDIHEGYEAWYTKDDITDWIIYTPTLAISPSTAYLLEK